MLLFAASVTGQTPVGMLIEAEANKPKSTSRVVAEANASGGAYVTSDKDWEPIFEAKLPDDGDRFRIYVRRRGGAVQLKSRGSGSGSDRDLKWLWDAPTQWTWTSVGTFDRATLGDRLLFIRGNKNPAPAIDAVVIADVEAAPFAATRAEPKAGTEAADLPSSKPDAQAAPTDVSAFVDWDRELGPITPLHWSVNDYTVVRSVKRAGQPVFNAYLDDAQPRLVRLHWAQLTDSWTDASTRSWDVEKIKASLEAATGLRDAEFMLSVNWAPKWLHSGKLLPKSKEAEFIRLVAELPAIMRDQVGRPVRYWELTNELEGVYEKAGRLDDLWSLFNRLADAVQQADPTAKIGGPALTWPKPAWLKPFLAASGDRIDFLTWHNYASGNPMDDNATIFAKADTIAGHAADALAMLEVAQPGRDIETFLTEYNISWTWETREARMGTNIGAVFQALVVAKLAELGVTGSFVWHVQDDIYGLIRLDGTRRAPADLFIWGPRHLTGTMHPVVTSAPDLLEGMAVTNADGRRNVLWMVKAGHTLRINNNPTLHVPGSQPWTVAAEIIAEGTPETATPPTMPAVYELPGYALQLWTQP